MGRFVRATLVVVGCALPLSAWAATTVAIAPFTTASSIEYQWVGPALADALSLRVDRQPELNAVTLRQVNAAMRQDAIQLPALDNPKQAIRVGKQLGADLMLTATYTAAWPDIELELRTLDPKQGKVLHTYSVHGDLDALPQLEAHLATLLAKALGAKHPDATPGAFGTTNLRAWRNTTLALEVLNWQSLAPEAADRHQPLELPEAAVKKALGQLDEAVKEDPSYGEAWAARGVAQALLGHTADAWKSFGKATSLGTGQAPTAVLGASFVRMREGHWDDAAKILKAAIAEHPGFMHARGYLGELYSHLGRYKEALKTFDAYAKRVPDEPWVLTQRGYAKSKLGDNRGAIADTTAAVHLLPDSPSLLLQLASRYIDAGKLVGAEDALRHALKIDPQKAALYVRLGYVYLLEGKDVLVIPFTKKALVQAKFGTSGHDLAYAHLNLARAYGHTGDMKHALEELELAKKAGLPSFAEVKADPKLAKLRADPRYKKLAL